MHILHLITHYAPALNTGPIRMTQLQASTHGSLTDEQATASLGVTALEPDTDPTRGGG